MSLYILPSIQVLPSKAIDYSIDLGLSRASDYSFHWTAHPLLSEKDDKNSLAGGTRLQWQVERCGAALAGHRSRTRTR